LIKNANLVVMTAKSAMDLIPALNVKLNIYTKNTALPNALKELSLLLTLTPVTTVELTAKNALTLKLAIDATPDIIY
jgi:hypothetical protein